MRNFRNSRRRERLTGLAVVSAFVLGGMGACVDVDNTFGEEYIPLNHRMELVQDAAFQIRTYNVTPDSVVSSLLPFNLLGSYRNEMTGVHVNGGIVFQMTPYRFPYAGADSLYGTDAVIDSAFISLSVYDYTGDPGVEQTFDIYTLTERVRLDSVYYYDFDPSPILPTEPLLSHLHSGTAGTIKIPVTDEAFLKQLVDTTGYRVDSLFRDRFKGFYITPRENLNAAGYRIDLSSASSSLDVYYHNYDETPDTAAYAYYSFSPYDYLSTTSFPNQSVNVVKRDYTNVHPDLALNDSLTPTARPVVESYGGIVTRLRFTKESVEALRQSVKEAGYTDIAVNRAKLQIGYPSRDLAVTATFQERLGMYTDFATTTGIVDYNWTSEYTYIVQGASYTPLAYSGWIRRSRFLYEMDITYYVQRLMRENYDRYDVYLGPSFETPNVGGADNGSNIHTTELSGSGSETPLNLLITYTMIR